MTVYRSKHRPSFQAWMPLLLAVCLAGGIWIGVSVQEEDAHPISLENNADEPIDHTYRDSRLGEIIRYIDSRYIQEKEADELEMTAILGLLKDLDPHSSYFTKAQLADINQQLDGSFEGIGINIVLADDSIVVVSPIKGGPAYEAGLRPGDRIVQINDTAVGEISESLLPEVMSRVMGKANTSIKLSVVRPHSAQLLHFTVMRDRIDLPSVRESVLLDDEIGYIRLINFTEKTYVEFMNAARSLKEQGMKHLMLDLRQNPGGYLHEAVKILNQFFYEKQKLLVYTEGDHAQRAESETTGKVMIDLDKIAILIDEGSASASEIVAGAVQDLDRGIVVGRRSFGKGLVQEQYSLSDGSALRLTIAKYYLPSGRCIQKAYGKDDYDDEIEDRLTSGELLDASLIALVDTQAYYTEKGRRVYGSIGILPDVYVPADTAYIHPLISKKSSHVELFTYEYANKLLGGKTLQQLQDTESPQNYIERYELPRETINWYADYLMNADAEFIGEYPDGIPLHLHSYLRTAIRAELIGWAFGEADKYAYLRSQDEVIRRAKMALRSQNPIVEWQH